MGWRYSAERTASVVQVAVAPGAAKAVVTECLGQQSFSIRAAAVDAALRSLGRGGRSAYFFHAVPDGSDFQVPDQRAAVRARAPQEQDARAQGNREPKLRQAREGQAHGRPESEQHEQLREPAVVEWE
jgi:hypothetical protein